MVFSLGEHNHMAQLVSVLVIGIGIGWLSGLSVSPVIGTVLASLVGVAGGIVAGVRSIARTPAEHGNVTPVSVDARLAALLVFGISVGAPLGIIARTYGIFENTPAQSDKVDRTDKPLQSDLKTQGVLFGISVEACDKLVTLARYPNERAFRDAVATTGNWGWLIERDITETATIKLIVGDLCSKR
jgi:hypothetical protein